MSRSVVPLLLLVGCSSPAAEPVAAPPDGGSPPDAVAPEEPKVPEAPPAPPPVMPAKPSVMLDAHTIPSGTTMLTTWGDTSGNGLDGTSTPPLAVDPAAFGGHPGVVTARDPGGSPSAGFLYVADVPTFRNTQGEGFVIFMVASFTSGASARTEDPILFSRLRQQPNYLNRAESGVGLKLDAALGTLTAELASLTAESPSTQHLVVAKGAAPAKGAPHLFVVACADGGLKLRVDGQAIGSATGFIEHGFAEDSGKGIFVGGGGFSAGRTLDGAVGMFAVYNRPLTMAEITQGEEATRRAWGLP